MWNVSEEYLYRYAVFSILLRKKALTIGDRAEQYYVFARHLLENTSARYISFKKRNNSPNFNVDWKMKKVAFWVGIKVFSYELSAHYGRLQ